MERLQNFAKNADERTVRIRLNGLVAESIVDGPGLRFVLFTQGCPHNCKGCHNPGTHSFENGYWEDVNVLLESFQENPLLSGVTLSGGEPFMQAEALVLFARSVQALGKSVFTYSGYTLEQLLELGKKRPAILELLELSDFLVDGPYLEEQRDLELRFRGSRNQRVLDLKEMRRKQQLAFGQNSFSCSLPFQNFEKV